MSRFVERITTRKYRGKVEETKKSFRILKRKVILGESRIYIGEDKYISETILNKVMVETSYMTDEFISHVWQLEKE